MATISTPILRPQKGWRGWDLRSADLLRDPDAASDTENWEVDREGNLVVRKGFKYLENGTGGSGMFKYVQSSYAGLGQTTEILYAGSQLYRLALGTFVITYTPGTAYDSLVASVQLDPELGGFVFSIQGDDTILGTFELGAGYDEASEVLLSDLETSIETISGMAVVNTGKASLPAAYLPPFLYRSFESNVLTVYYLYEEVVNQPSVASNPFATHYAERDDVNYRCLSEANMRNVIYFGSAYQALRKYDGQKVYLAGMPQPTSISASANSTGSGRTGTNIRYKATFKQVDNQGNQVEGIISSASGQVSPAADTVSVTVQALQTSTGYNTDYAQVNGGQVTVTTITVDSGHTLKVGDTAYFYDSVSASHVAREVTDKTATTIVIDGAAVTVADNAPISANLRVCLYTQEVQDGEYYLVDEYPHNPSASTQVVVDLGGTLGAQYLEPLAGAEPGLPPSGGYLGVYKGLLFIGGNLAAPSTFYFSDISSPEAFPPDSNNSNIETRSQDRITAIRGTTEYLGIFKNESSHVLTGDFDDAGSLRFRVDDWSLTVGVASHHSIAQIDDGSLLGLSSKGVFRFVGGAAPTEISTNILPLFRKSRSSRELSFALHRAQAIYDKENEKYLLFLPAETLTSSDYIPNSSSIMLCFDLFSGGTWWKWTNVNAWGGMVRTTGDEEANFEVWKVRAGLFWQEKDYSTVDAATVYRIAKRMEEGNVYDYADHDEAIAPSYTAGWDNQGDESGFKKILRLKVYSRDPGGSLPFSLDVEVRKDYVDSPSSSMSFEFFDGDDAGYGIAAYGNDPYGSAAEPEIERKITYQKVRAFSYRISNSQIHEKPLITGYVTEIAPAYNAGMKE